jgi:hypothetical protein
MEGFLLRLSALVCVNVACNCMQIPGIVMLSLAPVYWAWYLWLVNGNVFY